MAESERKKPVYEYEVVEELTVVNSYLVNATSKAEAKRLVLQATADSNLPVTRSEAYPTGRWWVERGNRVTTPTPVASATDTTGAGA